METQSWGGRETTGSLVIVVKGTEKADTTTAPTVTSVEITSDPNDDDRDGDDATYAIGDAIQATVTFSADVTVTGTPQLTLDVGGTDKTADYSATDSTATQLVFAYTVAANDADTDGIAIAANQLALNGGTIKAGTTDAVLTHAAVAADADHKVDGVRPTFVSAETSTDGTTITATFSETLSSVDHSQILVNNRQSSVSGATVSGATVVLTLRTALGHGQTVTVSLSLNTVRDAVGNGNAFSSNNSVTNNVLVATAVTGVEITSDPGSDDNYVTDDSIEVTVTFGTAMTVDTTNGTPRIQLSLTVSNSGNRWADYDSGSGTTALVFRYTVVASDESAAAGIRIDGNTLELNGGTIVAVSDNTPAVLSHTRVDRDADHRVNFAYPALESAATSTDGATIVLTYDEDLFGAGSVNLAIDRYALKVDNVAATLRTGSFAAVSGRTVTLTPATAVTAGQTVTLSYTDAAGDQTGVVQDAAGNDAPTFTDEEVTNNTVAPIVSSATVDGTSLVITFDKDLAAATSLVNTPFTVKKTPDAGTEAEVTLSDTPSISGATVTLTLAAAVVSTDTDVKVSYTKPASGSNNTLVDANGNEVATFTDQAVTNTTGVAAPTITGLAVTSTPVAANTYDTDETIEISVTFSAAVDVRGTPSLTFSMGNAGEAVSTDAAYASGTGTTVLVFAYTVQFGDMDDNGIFLVNDSDVTPNSAITLGSNGVIVAKDTETAANLALTVGRGDKPNHKVDGATNTGAPTITGLAVTSTPVAANTYDTDETIEISVTFSAAVDVRGTPSLTFSMGNAGEAVSTDAAYASGTGTTVLVFAYTVQFGDMDDNGIFLVNDSDVTPNSAITLGSNGVIVAKDTETAANLALTVGRGDKPNHKVDGATNTGAATVTSVALTSTPPVVTGYVTGDTIEVSVVFSEAVTVDTTDGTPSHQIGIDPRGARKAGYISGSGTTTLVFRYTVETEDQDDDGVFLRDGATDGALELNMGSITADDVAAVVDAYGGRGRQDAHKVNTQPQITALRVVSTPVLEDDTYGVDEEIRFEVEFDQVVVVSGMPRFELGIPLAPPDREFADYDGGSGTATLSFVYVVQATDMDDDGVYTGFSPAVELTGGSTIQGLGGRDAVLTHSIDATNHAGHKVDGSRSVVTGPTTVNTAPVAANDNVATGAGEAVTIDVLSNDRDAEDDALTVAAVTPPTSGTAAPNADNTRVVYTPSSGFTGTARFTYTVSDGEATATATVIVTVGVASVGTGICGRTAAVRNEILRVLTLAVSPGYTGTCSGVTADWLARATYLEFQDDDGPVTSLRRGDFAGLTGVRRLSFFDQPLTSLPAGVFDGLTSLRSLNLERGQLASLSPGVFDPLRGLTELVLSDNRLSSLGSGVFDGLTSLEWLDLRNNRLQSVPLAELEKLPALTRLLTQGNPGTRYRVEVSPPSVTVEQGGTTSYRVRLMRPGVWVVGTTSLGSTVRPTPPSESAGVRVTPERLTFVPANWFRSREVTVVAAGDATLGPVRIEHRASGKFSAPEVRVQVVPATATAEATAEDAPATIAGAPVVSDPGADGAWTPGEAVEVTLTFSEAVTVKTGGGTPSIGLQLNGTAPRAAAYARGSETRSLVFRYPVAAADGTVSSVIVPPNTLVLNGGAIDGATGVAADRSHVGAARAGSPVIPVQDPLTAAFEGMPETHDGSAFSFRVAFSEAVTADAAAVRGAFDVTGGSVTAAVLVAGETAKWAVTVTPDGQGDVTVALPATTDCAADGALCTVDGRRLTSTLSATVRTSVTPFLAYFDRTPSEHDGSAFTFHLQLGKNQNPAGLSYRTVRDHLLDVTGGTVTRAKRLTKGENQGWAITITPDANEDVRIAVRTASSCSEAHAVCTAGGQLLTGDLRLTVYGPASLSVANAEVHEAPGATLDFVVSLSRPASETVTVDYATADGSAQAGMDYTATRGTLTFAAGDTVKTVSVTVLDDSHNEGEETLTLTLSSPSGAAVADAEATGTIENTDPLPRALLARFGRATALHVMEQVEARLEASRASGFRGRFAGRELRRGMERDMGRNFLSRLQSTAVAGARDTTGVQSDLSGAELLRRGLGGGDLLMGSGFVLNRETGGGASVSLWSRGMESRFGGRDGELSLDGGVRTTMFGADYAKGPLMAGLMLSHRRGLGGYQGTDIGQVASSVTGLHPWVGYQLTERVTLWGVTGYGRGSLSLTPGETLALSTPLTSPTSLKGGLSMSMLAGGVRGDLVDAGVGGFGLAFKADALWVGTGSEAVDGPAGRLAGTEAVVTRVRTALEASRGYVFGHGIVLRPSLEVGLRRDGGDAETGAGADVAASLIASDPLTGLSVDVRVRTLLVHQDEGFRERGVSVSFSYDPTPQTPLGLTARVAPSWGGQAMSGADALWGRDTMEGLGAAGPGSGDRIDAELGYALPVGSRLVGTPRFGVTTSEYGRDYRLGYSLAVVQGGAMSFQFGLDAQRRESLGRGDADHSLVGRLTVGW